MTRSPTIIKSHHIECSKPLGNVTDLLSIGESGGWENKSGVHSKRHIVECMSSEMTFPI